MPTSKFRDEELIAIKKQYNETTVLSTITSVDTVKAGFMGLKKYVQYTIETKVFFLLD
jgi:hypothetical protein